MAKYKITKEEGKGKEKKIEPRDATQEDVSRIEKARQAAAEVRKKRAQELTRMSQAYVSVDPLSPTTEQVEEAQQSGQFKTPAKPDEQKRLEELWAANRMNKAKKRKAQDDDEDEVDAEDYEEDVDDSDGDPDFAPPGENLRGVSEDEDEFDSGEEGDTRRFRRFVPLKLDPSRADGNAKTAQLRQRRRLVRAERKKKEASRVKKTFKERREGAVDELKKLKDKKILKKRRRKRPERFYTHETLDKAVSEYKEQVSIRGLGLNIPKGTGCRAIAKKWDVSKSTIFDKWKFPNRRPFAGKSNQFSFQ